MRNTQYLYEDENLADEILMPGKTGNVGVVVFWDYFFSQVFTM